MLKKLNWNAVKYSITWEATILMWLPPLKVMIAHALGESHVTWAYMLGMVATLAAFDMFYVGIYQHYWDKFVNHKRSKLLSVSNSILYKALSYCFTVPMAMWILGMEGSSALIMQVCSSIMVLTYGAFFKHFWKGVK